MEPAWGQWTRRAWLQAATVGGTGWAVAGTSWAAGPLTRLRQRRHPDWVVGRMSGAEALVSALQLEGVGCVFGIPGAQENELWDTFKQKGLPYLLVAHEFSAACMADGYARSTGQPGVLCVVPGPGVTNSLTGLGEALLDSSPVVAIVGDVANGDKARPFQVHSLPQVELLKPVCKCVFPVHSVEQIPGAVRQAFVATEQDEPGPVAVVIPYNLLIEVRDFRSPPPPEPPPPWDEQAFAAALALLADPAARIGIYAGYGCMEASAELQAVAELLQAPVATSVSGKGVIPETHPLAVGWGFGPHASEVAEKVFAIDARLPQRVGVTTLLAIGVKFSEVSTGYYSNPQPQRVIHVDRSAANLGRILRTDVCVHADAKVFLGRLLAHAERLRRPVNKPLLDRIAQLKAATAVRYHRLPHPPNGVDPLALILALRCYLPPDALVFTDVTVSEHLAAEYFTVVQPRTYFNPVDNQAMGWSIPAAIGAQRVHPGRCTVALVGDGCALMTALELSTAAREHLPVKFFVLDDQAYHYMQMLQLPAYLRTTATILARIDYKALAQAMGLTYVDITSQAHLDERIPQALHHPGPVLVRVATDYHERKIRWIEAVRGRYARELTPAQKARFLARIGARALRFKEND
ncbi:MAG: thiamine pyrophosphate-binding protein [Gemmataceae bacterium]|nr:thiamine pyrophosphate-binding protein [Gemmataceae bacterium]MDW8243308.1 thiamine pyrophosphate-binding protein [Thermogemmata sp.]